MDLCALLLLFIIGFLTFWYFKKELNYFKELGLPHIPPWPFFGNMIAPLFQRKHIIDVLDDAYNLNSEAKYVGFYNFRTPIILLRDPDIIKNITVKYFDHFPDHGGLVDEKVDPFFGKNLFSLQGYRWHRMRSLLSPVFTSSKLKTMFSLIRECAEDFVDFVANKGPVDHDMKNILTRFTTDVFATTAFGMHADSMKFPNNEVYSLARKTLNLEGVLSMKLFFAKKFPTFMRYLGVKIIPPDTASFFKNIVHSTVRMRDNNGITRPDMLQLMMDARNRPGGHVLDIEEMTGQALSFFIGSFDATATSMSALAHELAVNPKIQERLQAEIDAVLQETDGNPTYESINNMPYMDSVLYEINRLYTRAVFLDRVCVKSFELPPSLPGMKPFTVKPGMNVWIPATSFHRDSRYYDEPTKYDPERFLQKKVTPNQTTYLSFGIGPRMCIAREFALLQTKILYFHLLAKCNLRTCEKTNVPFQLNPMSFALNAKGGFWVRIEPRTTITVPKLEESFEKIEHPRQRTPLCSNCRQRFQKHRGCRYHVDHQYRHQNRRSSCVHNFNHEGHHHHCHHEHLRLRHCCHH